MERTSEDTAILSLFPREEWCSINMSQARYLKRKYDAMMEFQKDGSFEYFKNECKKRNLESCGVFKGICMKTAYNRLVTGCRNNEIKRSRINKIMHDLDGPLNKVLLSRKLLTTEQIFADIYFTIDWIHCLVTFNYHNTLDDYSIHIISHNKKKFTIPDIMKSDYKELLNELNNEAENICSREAKKKLKSTETDE